MTYDELLGKATQYVLTNTPFFVFKPDINSFDAAIPHLAAHNNLPLVKIAVHDLGQTVKVVDALNLIRWVLHSPMETQTLIWIEDISGVDDKEKLVADVLEYAKKEYEARIVFSGNRRECGNLSKVLPTLDWDTQYHVEPVNFTQVFPDKCCTDVAVYQDMHFRVYNNCLETILNEMKFTPVFSIENCKGEKSTFDSIISVAALGIKRGDRIRVHSNYDYIRHMWLVNSLLAGWQKPVDLAVAVDAKHE